jgi:Uma2 family endonuclease
MVSTARAYASAPIPRLPLLLKHIPILYEDEDEGDMGESNPHVTSDVIVHVCLKAYLTSQPRLRVFSNMNLYYRNGPRHPRTGSLPYVSPDIMVVEPYEDLGEEVSSYTIGRDGPAPLLTTEILSKRSGQQSDLKKKPIVYAKLGIPEYLLVDPLGKYLRERLVLRRLQPDRTWREERDADGGVTSQLGFRLIWDTDGLLRLFDARTGERYFRPGEVQEIGRARQQAEERIRQLEAELAQLRGEAGSGTERKPSTKRRRKS